MNFRLKTAKYQIDAAIEKVMASRMKRLKMNDKIFLLTFFIILFTLLISTTFIMGSVIKEQSEQYGQRAMLVARTVSNMTNIVHALELKDQNEAIQQINTAVEQVRIINQAKYIVVMDLDRIRYSHPNNSMLGTKSQSQDIQAALNEHYYISKAKGESGTMIRAFVPILNEEREQIGVVVVGFAVPTIADLLDKYEKEILIVGIVALILSMWGAYLLAQHIKRQMFGLEPEEISRMYMERQETFNAMHEGVIAIDNNYKITIFNERACEILGVGGNPIEFINRYIYEIIPDSRLPEIVDTKKAVYDQEIFVNDHNILSNRIPIFVKGKIVGAVAIFKDMTQVRKMAEELTGVKAFVQALRVQTHEHKNKLHTITGLLQLGHVDKAIEYLTTIQHQDDSITKFLKERFANENISGLLLSKYMRAKELGIQLEIDEHSSFKKFPKGLNHHDFVVILGNLIENAFDALNVPGLDEKKITLSIEEHDGMLAILVSDTGIGIPEDVIENIFENGFSTKQGNSHGIGLHLVHEIVKKGNGSIEVSSEVGNGTTFVLLFEIGDE